MAQLHFFLAELPIVTLNLFTYENQRAKDKRTATVPYHGAAVFFLDAQSPRPQLPGGSQNTEIRASNEEVRGMRSSSTIFRSKNSGR